MSNFEILRTNDPIRDDLIEVQRFQAASEHAAACGVWNLDATGSPIREKNSTGSPQGESGFTPEGAIGKTVGLSYEPEAQ
jgi:hypothetical protein